MRVGPDFREAHTLSDGTRVTLRLIQPSDKEELARGIRMLSPESRYLRFFAAGAEPSEEQLRYLTEVDGKDHLAIVAGVESLDLKTERGVGVARFVRLEDDPSVAEAAVVVADDLHNRGLGTLLLTVLARAAWERGIRSFRGEILAANEPMRKMLELVGARLTRVDGETLAYDVPLGDEAEPAARESPIRRVFRELAASMAEVVRRLGPRG
jgi:RimJ/RimL family protein N-acetyltransferase